MRSKKPSMRARSVAGVPDQKSEVPKNHAQPTPTFMNRPAAMIQ